MTVKMIISGKTEKVNASYANRLYEQGLAVIVPAAPAKAKTKAADTDGAV